MFLQDKKSMMAYDFFLEHCKPVNYAIPINLIKKYFLLLRNFVPFQFCKIQKNAGKNVGILKKQTRVLAKWLCRTSKRFPRPVQKFARSHRYLREGRLILTFYFLKRTVLLLHSWYK